jgi:predicted nucleic-acid-binding Zn-ribbon protein
MTESKTISETKCTCQACGSIWHYGKQDKTQQAAAASQNVGKAMMCCGGCIPALFIPNQNVVDLKKCPKCGSKAVKSEEVVHTI